MDMRHIIQYIPTALYREQNDWLNIAHLCKAAGIAESDFDEWCQRDQEKYSRDVLLRYRGLKPSEDKEHACNILRRIARDHGYIDTARTDCYPRKATPSCFRKTVRPNDEKLPSFDQRQARMDTIKLLTVLGCRFVVADYLRWEDNGKVKTRPRQEASYPLELSDLTSDERCFQKLEAVEHGSCFLLNRIDEKRLADDRAADICKGVTKEHFVSFDWCLLESDEGTLEEQWDKIMSLDLPLLAIVHSGNKSLHCYCHIGAGTLSEYESRTNILMEYCLRNGFKVDTATRNINRWVRFPYARRGEKMQYPVKVCETFKTFDQWEKQATYTIDIFDRDSGKDSRERTEVNIRSMMKLLTENGFRRNSSGDTFFRLEGCMATPIAEGSIHTFVYDWVKEYYPDDLNSFAYHRWEPTRLKMLEVIPDARHNDTREASFFYFNNVAVQISAGGIQTIPYPELPGLIDTQQKIVHDIRISEERGDFSRFVELICGEDASRVTDLMSALGYLMHRYKSPSRVKAIILTDESLTDENGGTGKGLLFQALSKMRYCQSVDMKTRERNRFFFSTVKVGCSILHLDDVQEDFDFNYLFNILANDMEIEAKGANRFVIPFPLAPKIYVSTNFAFRNMEKDSYKRRMAIYELHRKFNADYQPVDEFKRNFFLDWDKEEWNRFYNFMLQCSAIYMREGLRESEAKFVKQKSLRAEFLGKEEFLDFIQAWEEEGLLEQQISNSQLMARWLHEKGTECSAISLTKLLNRYCECKNYEITHPRQSHERAFIIHKRK